MWDIKITSLNVNGLNNPIKRKKVLQKMKREGGNVMFLQETHLSREEHKKLERLANTQVHSASFHSARRGVAILIMNNTLFHTEKTIADKDGRYILVKGRIDNAEIQFFNVYKPPEQGPDFISKIIGLVILEAKGTVIMGGDLNLEYIMQRININVKRDALTHRALSH
uniref:exodeoxyribonuclease III n=1 Tax=Labrus bergylta TaxID=56723 RepID=A0A3Q3G5X7_9LABR